MKPDLTPTQRALIIREKARKSINNRDTRGQHDRSCFRVLNKLLSLMRPELGNLSYCSHLKIACDVGLSQRQTRAYVKALVNIGAIRIVYTGPREAISQLKGRGLGEAASKYLGSNSTLWFTKSLNFYTLNPAWEGFATGRDVIPEDQDAIIRAYSHRLRKGRAPIRVPAPAQVCAPIRVQEQPREAIEECTYSGAGTRQAVPYGDSAGRSTSPAESSASTDTQEQTDKEAMQDDLSRLLNKLESMRSISSEGADRVTTFIKNRQDHPAYQDIVVTLDLLRALHDVGPTKQPASRGFAARTRVHPASCARCPHPKEATPQVQEGILDEEDETIETRLTRLNRQISLTELIDETEYTTYLESLHRAVPIPQRRESMLFWELVGDLEIKHKAWKARQ